MGLLPLKGRMPNFLKILPAVVRLRLRGQCVVEPHKVGQLRGSDLRAVPDGVDGADVDAEMPELGAEGVGPGLGRMLGGAVRYWILGVG